MNQVRKVRPPLLIAGGGIAIAGILAFSGLTGAQTPQTTPSPDSESTPMSGQSQSYEDYLAEELDVSVEELREASENARDSYVEDLVAEGEMTESQAEAVREHVSGRVLTGAFLNADVTSYLHEALVTKVASLTNASPDEIRQELEDGRSIEEVANDRGVSSDELRTEITNSVQGVIDRAEEENLVGQEAASMLRDGVESVVGDFLFPEEDGTSGSPTPMSPAPDNP